MSAYNPANITVTPGLASLYDGWPASNFGMRVGYDAGLPPTDLFSASGYIGDEGMTYLIMDRAIVYSDDSAGVWKYEVVDSQKAATGKSGVYTIGEFMGAVDWHEVYDLGGVFLALTYVTTGPYAGLTYPAGIGAPYTGVIASLLYLQEQDGYPLPAVKQWALEMDATTRAAILADVNPATDYVDITRYLHPSGVIDIGVTVQRSGFYHSDYSAPVDLRAELAPFLFQGGPAPEPAWWEPRSGYVKEV